MVVTVVAMAVDIAVAVNAAMPPIATCNPHAALAQRKVVVVTAAAMVVATVVAQVMGVVLAVAMVAVTHPHGPAIISLTPCAPVWT